MRQKCLKRIQERLQIKRKTDSKEHLGEKENKNTTKTKHNLTFTLGF